MPEWARGCVNQCYDVSTSSVCWCVWLCMCCSPGLLEVTPLLWHRHQNTILSCLFLPSLQHKSPLFYWYPTIKWHWNWRNCGDYDWVTTALQHTVSAVLNVLRLSRDLDNSTTCIYTARANTCYWFHWSFVLDVCDVCICILFQRTKDCTFGKHIHHFQKCQKMSRRRCINLPTKDRWNFQQVFMLPAAHVSTLLLLLPTLFLV